MAYDDQDANYALGGTGALNSIADPEVSIPENGLSSARAAIARRQALQRDQQAYYDQMAKQLEQRRTGPSTSEQLFELSAALARPTTVRGFSGVLNNVMPVLQQQARAKREGMEGRTEALNALQMAQMKVKQGLADTEVDTELALAKLMAKPVAKPRTGFNPLTGELVDMNTGRPVTDAPLPTLTPEQVAEMARNPANRGKKFLTVDGRPMEM